MRLIKKERIQAQINNSLKILNDYFVYKPFIKNL